MSRAISLAASAARTATTSFEVSTPEAKGALVILTASAVADVEAATVATQTGGVGTAEIQTITVAASGGTFTITWAGQTTSALAYNITAADLEDALDALSNIADGDVEVTGGPGDLTGTTPYTLTWLARLGNVAAPTTTATLLTGGAHTATVATGTPGTGPTNEVQTVTVAADGGTFTLTYAGQTTSALAYNAVAATVETALIALSNIGPGEVAVTGGPGNPNGATPYVVTFQAGLGGTNVAAMTSDASSLTLAGSIVATIQAPDPASGDWYDILASAAITAAGTTRLRVYPGLTASPNATVSDLLPGTWRVTVTASDATPVTYSISAWVFG